MRARSGPQCKQCIGRWHQSEQSRGWWRATAQCSQQQTSSQRTCRALSQTGSRARCMCQVDLAQWKLCTTGTSHKWMPGPKQQWRCSTRQETSLHLTTESILSSGATGTESSTWVSWRQLSGSSVQGRHLGRLNSRLRCSSGCQVKPNSCCFSCWTTAGSRESSHHMPTLGSCGCCPKEKQARRT